MPHAEATTGRGTLRVTLDASGTSFPISGSFTNSAVALPACLPAPTCLACVEHAERIAPPTPWSYDPASSLLGAGTLAVAVAAGAWLSRRAR